MGYPRQKTVRYTTYIKQSLVEALKAVLELHPDPTLQDTKVRLERSFEEADYPMILVDYHEGSITDAGVGHYEKGYDSVNQRWYKRQRKFYHGSASFTIFGLSTLDRDIIGDALIQTLMMSSVSAYTDLFLTRIYHQETFEAIKSLPAGTLGTAHYYNMLNMGTQNISPTGASAVPNPWGAEDVLVYQKGYSMAIFGEFISLPPEILYNILSDVIAYPYVGGVDTVPTGTNDPALWLG